MNELQSSITRQDVINFEKLMERGEKIELKCEHYFANNLYGRTLFIPKGVILTGKIHKHEHLVILLTGCISILIGGKIQKINAPYIWKSEAGIKRIIRAHEDSLMMNVHSNLLNETNLDLIEEYFVCNTEQEYLKYIAQEPLLPFNG